MKIEGKDMKFLTWPSEAVRESVRLVISDGGDEPTVIPVLGRRFLIGRSSSCQLRSRSPVVSREHAAIETEDDATWLRDLASLNGTVRNGRSVTEAVRLQDGDHIEIGPLAFTVSIRPIDEDVDEDPGIEDQVASWLIDEPRRSEGGPDSGSFGGATHIGAPRRESR
jgi:hypothetical protein